MIAKSPPIRMSGLHATTLTLWLTASVDRLPIIFEIQVLERLLEKAVIDGRFEVKCLFDQTVALRVLDLALVLRHDVLVDQRARPHFQRLTAGVVFLVIRERRAGFRP